jgi:Tfp pilus assembly protein PilF
MILSPKLKSPTFIYSLVIALYCFIIYANTLGNKYSIDDEIVVYNNKTIAKGIKAIPEIFTSYYVQQSDHAYGYRPVAKATFAIEYSIFGANPALSHLGNILLYCLLCVMIFLVFKKIFQLNQKSLLFLFLSVILFASHPIHTEVVASLKNREEILCFLFGLLAMYFFSFPLKRKNLWYILPGVMSLIMSVLTKPSGSVFALIIPLQIFFFFNKSDSEKTFDISSFRNLIDIDKIKAFLFKILPNRPFVFDKVVEISIRFKAYKILTFIIILIVLTLISIKSIDYPESKLPTHSKVENWHNPQFVSESETLKYSTFLESNLFYLKKLCLPYPLLFYYGYNMFPEKGLNTFTHITSLLLIIFLLSVALLLLKKRHIFSFAIFFYFFSICIFLNYLIPITGIVAERLVFIASWGFCLAITFLLFSIFKEPIIIDNDNAKNVTPFRRKVFIGFFITIILVFSAMTIHRNTAWKTHFSIVESDIKHLNKSFFSNTYYASCLENIYQSNKKPEVLKNIIKHYKIALKINPDYDIGWNNLGKIYLEELKTPDSAAYFLKKAVSINDTNDFAFLNLGYANEQIKNNKDAKSNYLRCLQINHKFDLASLMLANLYFYKFNLPDSAEYYNRRVIANDKANDAPYLNLGNYEISKKDTLKAIEFFEKAFEINPRNPGTAYNIFKYYSDHNNKIKAEYYKRYLTP